MISGLLVLLVVLVFGHSAGFGLVAYDDGLYLRNEIVQRGLTAEGIAYAFDPVTDRFYWHPLTWLSYMAVVDIAGPGPHAQHAVNVALHALAAVLVFWFWNAATDKLWHSAAAAALFAIHPLRAESVAWLSERKDVLCGLFVALTCLLYVRYAHKPTTRKYAFVLLASTLALMSKPAAVSLPFLLLILDRWPLARKESITQLVREKLPLIALSAVVAIMTVIGQRAAGALDMMEPVPLAERLLRAPEWLSHYLLNTIWPTRLVIPYPYDQSTSATAIALAAIMVLTWTLWRLRKRHPALAAGVLWFTIALLPSLGIIQAGSQSMGDRFTYIPHIGLAAGLVWTLATALTPGVQRLACAGAIVALSIVCVNQVSTWRDTRTLFTNAVENSSNNWVAHLKLGLDHLDNGRLSEAEKHLREATRIKPDSVHAQYAFARWAASTNRLDEARLAFAKSIELKPDYAEAHYSLGSVLVRSGDPARGQRALQRTLELPATPELRSLTHNLLGTLAAQRNDLTAALRNFELAVAADPNNTHAQTNRARARALLGH